MAIKRVAIGTVYLLGAGPGDPELLTRKAHKLLQEVDVIAYDELISEEMRAEFPQHAVAIPVGRRCGEGETPFRVHPKVIEHAFAGRNVARLKAGDSFVFGRGGEEIEELQSLDIPYEVVPGISAAFGAAASVGVPLTMRGVSSKLTFITGHDASGFDRAGDLSSYEDDGTVVLYMASRRIAANVARLKSMGFSEDTPIICIVAATQPNEHHLSGTLVNIVEKARTLSSSDPVVIIVGKVARLAKSKVGNQIDRSAVDACSR